MSIATQIGRIAKAKKDIKEVVNQDFEVINNETIDKYAEKMGSAYDEYESYIPWEHGEGDEFTFKKGGAGSYLKELEINGNTEQTTYTGKNLLIITNSGETKNGITYKKNEDGSITLNGTATANTNIRISTQRITQPNTYSFGVTTDKLECGGYIYNSDGSFKYNLSSRTGRTPRTISNGEYITNFFIYIIAGQVFNNLTLYPQLELGSTSTEYEPFVGGTPSPNPDYPQDVRVVTGNNTISVCGKNLFDGEIEQGTLNYFTGQNEDSSTNTRTKNYIKIKPNTRYTLSGIAKTRWCCFYDIDKNFISISQASSQAASGSIITPNNAYYIRWYLVGNTDINIQEQLEVGSTATTYEPYQSQTYPINLGTMELCKIGNYQDYLYKDNGKWYKHSEIGKVVLDGSETGWHTSSLSVTGYKSYYVDSSIRINQDKTGKCNYFEYKTFNEWQSLLEATFIENTYNAIGIRVAETLAPTLEDFKTWLSTHNTIVYYVLATPTNEEITDTTLISQLEELTKLDTYNNYTAVTATGDLINPELECVLFSQPAYQK